MENVANRLLNFGPYFLELSTTIRIPLCINRRS
ncbi:hypothetical protein HPDFL43_00027570 [Hoeflea phototrophica DFL-43]|uniref:Uncharacterized protein n=1 Tax=Hoeflea phototrophica (strain DSM 17068 / NCIMB 14078 / DFL-43) TaxID=411684 RepID=A0A094YYQ8_HOEPD|nr:hypothetical protein HPDFL43_00027570 [Hoeflea phototrophica DFL-43]